MTPAQIEHQAAYAEALAVDDAFDRALQANGIAGRWHWHKAAGGEWLQSVYRRKIAADQRMIAASRAVADAPISAGFPPQPGR